MTSLSGFLGNVVYYFITIMEYAVCARCVLSWFVSPLNRFMHLLISITEPIMQPARSVMQRIFGNARIDFSPIITIFLLNLLRTLAVRLFF